MFGYLDEFKAGGMMIFASVSLPTRGKNRAHRLIESSIGTLDEGDWLTEDNLNAAKRYLLRQELEKQWYAADMADSIGWYADRINDPEKGVVGAQEEIEQVALADVERVWKQYIVNNKPVKVFFKKGPPQQTQAEIAAGGDQ